MALEKCNRQAIIKNEYLRGKELMIDANCVLIRKTSLIVYSFTCQGKKATIQQKDNCSTD